jgi:hypothetical protein
LLENEEEIEIEESIIVRMKEELEKLNYLAVV